MIQYHYDTQIIRQLHAHNWKLYYDEDKVDIFIKIKVAMLLEFRDLNIISSLH